MGPSQEKDAGTDRIARMEALVEEHETALLRYAQRLTGDSSAAQDVVQKVFVSLCDLWQRRGYPPIVQPRAWLFRSTHHAAVDWIRAEQRRNRLHERHAREQAAATPFAAAEGADERRAAVLRHLHALTAAEQQVLLLRLEQELPYDEIAAVTGRTVGNVGCLLHHAVKKLGARLRHEGAPVSAANGVQPLEACET